MLRLNGSKWNMLHSFASLFHHGSNFGGSPLTWWLAYLFHSLDLDQTAWAVKLLFLDSVIFSALGQLVRE